MIAAGIGAAGSMFLSAAIIMFPIAMAIGNMMIAADKNIDPAAPMPAAIITSGETGDPTGSMR